MQTDLKSLAAAISQTLGTSLKAQGRQIAALTAAEGEALAQALERIAGLMARGEVSREEGEVLLRIQSHASEAVLASLAEVSRLAATRAVADALETGLAQFGDLWGAPAQSGLTRTLAG